MHLACWKSICLHQDKRQEFKDADRKEGNQKAYVKWSLNRLPVYYISGLRQYINVAEFDEGDTFEKTKKN